MAQLTTTHAFTITGDPIYGYPVPELRAEGAPMSQEQIGMARAVYDRFAGDFRVSLLPFHTQQGTLPDGSPYRIVAMRGHRIMQVWPQKRARLTIIGGIGMEAMYGGAAGLTVITFDGAGWLVKAVSEFYGGSGVWVGYNGRYLTDDTPRYAQVPQTTYRHFQPGMSSVPVKTNATSVRTGLAYDGQSGAGFGMFAANGKYVAVALEAGSRIGIYEVDAYPAVHFSETPNVPDSIGYQTLYIAQSALDASVGTSAGLSGRGFGTRLRDGSAFCFATGREGVTEFSMLDLGAGPWLGNYPLEYEFQFLVSPAGYSDRVVRVVDEGATQEWEWVPDPSQFGDRFEAWRRVINADLEYTQGALTNVPAVYTYDGIALGTASHPARMLVYMHYAYDARFTRERKGLRRPVYVARDWDDNLVIMHVSADETHEYHTTAIEDTTGLMVNFQENMGVARDVAYYSAPGVDNRDANGVGTFTSSSRVSWTEPEGIDSSGRADKTLKYKRYVGRMLHTPHGDLALATDDTTLTVELSRTGYAGALSVTGRSIVGTSLRRYVKHIDPVLSVVAFVELRTPRMSISGNIVSTNDSSADFVVLVRGRELYRLALSAAESATAAPDTIFSISSSHDVPYAMRTEAHFKPLTITERGYYPLMQTAEDSEGALRTTYVRPYETAIDRDASVSGWVTNDDVTAAIDPDYFRFVPPVATVENADSVVIRCAVDPTSGGGVVMVHQEGAFRGGWAITPDGVTTPVAALLAKARPAALGAIHELLVSV